ncbi:MAG: pentapeptide repeat-containing protein [Leptolyngbyaceae cyanobacterium]
MANEDQVALIARGSKVWRIWREEHPNTKIDLRSAYLINFNLSYADLSEASLWKANLSGAYLRGADLGNTDLRNADLRNADLSGANLYNADLRNADFTGSDLSSANLVGACLCGADLTNAVLINTLVAGADLSEVELRGAIYNNQEPPRTETEKSNFSKEQMDLLKQGREVWNDWRRNNLGKKIALEGANLVNADLMGFDLREADLRQADFHGAFLNSAEFSRANLSKANFEEAELFCANFDGADLSNAYFSYAKLNEASFSKAKLCNAYFNDAYMSDVNFTEANLRAADLRRTDSSNSNFSDADLCNALMCFADFCAASFSRANLSGADLGGSDLRSADFSNAALMDTYFCKANLERANLNNANLKNADLGRAILRETDLSGSNLTGACISNWYIEESTILNDVNCDYIFRTFDNRLMEFSGRLPVDPENIFATGEFTNRFQIIASALETIDLTFTKGIDWQAFFESFQELKSDLPEEDISIQGMERKDDAFIIRIEAAFEADKAVIETKVKQLYLAKLKAIEARYRERFQLQGAHLKQQGAHLKDIRSLLQHERRENTRLNKAVEILALRQQSLNEDAREIRDLLITLANTCNMATDTGKEKLMEQLGQEVKRHPKWRRALKEGGIELIKVLCAPIGVPLEMARIYLEEE